VEVEVERPLADAGARGDLVGTRRRKALFDEQAEGGIQKLSRPRVLASSDREDGAIDP